MTERQKNLLRSLVPGLKSGEIKAVWTVVYTYASRLPSILELDDLDASAEQLWSQVDDADLQVFVNCGYLHVLQTIDFGGRQYSVYVQRIIDDFSDPVDSMEILAGSHGENNKMTNATSLSRKIFIVHGHDEEMKSTVARFLENLDLEPIILHEQLGHGRTIIEKFETHASDVDYAIVLLSPDDLGGDKSSVVNSSDPKDVLRSRARQNVILELGYFLGLLGRQKVFALYRSTADFELPSDYNAVEYAEYPSKDWTGKLFGELKELGYDLNHDVLLPK